MTTRLRVALVSVALLSCFATVVALLANGHAYFQCDARNKLNANNSIADFRAEQQLAQRASSQAATHVLTLGDKNQPTKRRVQCARILAELKYAPAIPELIENITLTDPDVTVSDDGTPLVCMIALQEFEVAAVPQIVVAYLDEPDPVPNISRNEDTRRMLLLMVIGGGRTSRVATTHFLGLSARGDHRITPAKTKEWNDYLGKK